MAKLQIFIFLNICFFYSLYNYTLTLELLDSIYNYSCELYLDYQRARLSFFSKFKLAYVINSEIMNIMIFLSLFFYFFNTFCLSVSTFFFGVRGVYIVSILSIFITWVVQIFYFNYIVVEGNSYFLNLDFMGVLFSNVEFNFSLKIDLINFSFLFLTTSIGLCAIIYSLTYFKNEPNSDRFIIFLNWFILSMSLLVLSDNAILLFLGWELIGLTSFLLINFWTVRRGTLKSAIKAFTFNKLSDVFLLFFIIIFAQLTNTASISVWLSYLFLIDYKFTYDLFSASIFLILASSIKSAQIIGHLWLPDSMEAPIPASALIHSATLVSAGVYLLLKFNFLLFLTNTIFFVAFLGSITAFYGAVVSAAQTDCKKLLAYSTISHCGFLFITVCFNDLSLTIIYLYLHGFFKALTFFCVGNLVKVAKGYQDTRRMGQLNLLLPVESFLLVFCCLNLSALPFTVGYFYKHLMHLFLIDYPFVVVFFPFLFFGMLASIIYAFRLIFYSLFDINKGYDVVYESYFKSNINSPHHSNSTFLGIFSIATLAVFSVFISKLYLEFFTNYSNFVVFFESISTKISFSENFFTSGYMLFFYSFFLVLGFILLKIECRGEFSHFKKNYFWLYIFIFVFFIALFLSL